VELRRLCGGGRGGGGEEDEERGKEKGNKLGRESEAEG